MSKLNYSSNYIHQSKTNISYLACIQWSNHVIGTSNATSANINRTFYSQPIAVV